MANAKDTGGRQGGEMVQQLTSKLYIFSCTATHTTWWRNMGNRNIIVILSPHCPVMGITALGSCKHQSIMFAQTERLLWIPLEAMEPPFSLLWKTYSKASKDCSWQWSVRAFRTHFYWYYAKCCRMQFSLGVARWVLLKFIRLQNNLFLFWDLKAQTYPNYLDFCQETKSSGVTWPFGTQMELSRRLRSERKMPRDTREPAVLCRA